VTYLTLKMLRFPNQNRDARGQATGHRLVVRLPFNIAYAYVSGIDSLVFGSSSIWLYQVRRVP
jgi:hypothetical protein